jgi:hypothetical protein
MKEEGGGMRDERRIPLRLPLRLRSPLPTVGDFAGHGFGDCLRKVESHSAYASGTACGMYNMVE